MKTNFLRACCAIGRWSTGSILLSALAQLTIALPAWADTFGSGPNSFTIDFVTIGDPGNPPDQHPHPAGAVSYNYRIGKYEIPEDPINKADALGDFGITIDSRGPDKPATSLTWYEAAEFVNWLNTSTGHPPAYKFDASGNFQLWLPADAGYDATNRYRSKLAKYFLPSLNEWHKAAYDDPVAGHYWVYPTGGDSIPDGIDFSGDPNFDAVFFDGGINPGPNDTSDVGLLSPYGTAGQRDNVDEWVETAFDRHNDLVGEARYTVGRAWTNEYTVLQAIDTGGGDGPQFAGDFIGIRVASAVPEPAGCVLLTVCALPLIVCVCHRYRTKP